ncbi:rhomboid family intramembrane serine protease [Natrononativus amylolyticus]|uniref:rhomboid family intramembrane serine protease n=1 Tax=Natrononativus amylolyticus TaxID=2963434 RepID=UPI0020CBDFAB|nr:rhomboid family intramembrane serine protease [Natrononativus amylolyticus]
MLSLTGGLALVIVATVLVSVGAIRLVDRSSRRWRDVLRARLVWGVPWGTLVVCTFVLCVYLFVQDGITDFRNPVTIPYRAWSYFSPLGMATSSFSHADSGHLIGNLTGALVVAPIAEYAWGHYPRSRESAPSWRTNPWVRALVVFPLVVIAVGLLTSLFAVGPVIGFSGVVFAFAGFAIVRYPIVTVLATLGAHGTILTIYRALEQPIRFYEATASPPGPPSWATIAIQGHAIGFLFGFVLAAVVFHRRGYRPDPLALWIALLFFAFSKSLWAIYWFGGENVYILLQGPGVVVVTALAVVLTLAVTASDRPLGPPRPGRWLERIRGYPADAGSGTVRRPRPLPSTRSLSLGAAGAGGDADGDRFERIAAIAGGTRRSRAASSNRWPGRRASALVVVVLVVALISGPAIPVNLFVVDGEHTSERAVTAGDYTVEYTDGTENQLVPVIEAGPFENATSLESSGVIVSSADRNIWMEATTTSRLAHSGDATVYVGGPGWREAVHVDREGWSATGNSSVYQVWLRVGDGDRSLAYESEASQADPTIADRNVTVHSEGGEFRLAVTSADGEEAMVDLPAENESVDANGLTLEYDDDAIYAIHDGTRVEVASAESYD